MSSQVLTSQTRETHDEIMMLMSKTKKMKLSSEDSPIKINPFIPKIIIIQITIK